MENQSTLLARDEFGGCHFGILCKVYGSKTLDNCEYDSYKSYILLKSMKRYWLNS
ncbi:hypothetical protein [Clostridioides difficile]|uniref:hypothetical protein n=1 Tax=Clostridioides difficile TaxID=1496 RepID=UPI00374FCAA3